jgi:RNA polymerase sigma-70 factor, ECF subfamily
MKKKHSQKNHYQNVLFEHLFNDLHAPLFFYALKFIDDKEVARDLVQDAFLNLLSKGSEISGIVKIKYYLFACVRNNCINYLNHLRVENKFQKEEIERSKREIVFYDTNKALIEKELHLQIMNALNELPDHYRIPFELSRFENLKNKEIADKLQIPVRSVETRIYRALGMLRKKLSGMITLICALFYLVGFFTGAIHKF